MADSPLYIYNKSKAVKDSIQSLVSLIRMVYLAHRPKKKLARTRGWFT